MSDGYDYHSSFIIDTRMAQMMTATSLPSDGGDDDYDGDDDVDYDGDDDDGVDDADTGDDVDDS